MRFVPVDKLEPGMVLGRSIYNSADSVLLVRGIPLTLSHILRLQGRGYLGAYIDDEFSKDIEIDEMITPELFNEGIDAVKDRDLARLMDISKRIVAEILANKQLNPELLDLRAYDDYTYHHSVNVAVYACVIAKEMELKQQDIESVTLAAICHDLGKMLIPTEILNKPAKLTEEEYRMIKEHSRYSYDILADNVMVNSAVRQGVLHHHENENGTGYPDGLEGEHIPWIAKIIHAADVYDALTSKRPYKDPYSTADAMEYIMGGSSILFDRDVVSAMMRGMPAYMPGMEVSLSNGEQGMVVRNTDLPMRPIIRLIPEGEDVNLFTDPRYQNVVILSESMAPGDFADEVEKISEQIIEQKSLEMRRVLVVDDSATILAYLERILSPDYAVASARSGLKALDYITLSGMPDAIILDIQMPEMNGIETAKYIREKMNSSVPIIFLTGLADKGIVMRCKELGAADYILKPVNEVYIRERLALILGKFSPAEETIDRY
ncbi:MAG: response regulator [Lachnospiraceae bacterium]|nr:response regulator [Lachnospiraceae bacterium]